MRVLLPVAALTAALLDRRPRGQATRPGHSGARTRRADAAALAEGRAPHPPDQLADPRQSARRRQRHLLRSHRLRRRRHGRRHKVPDDRHRAVLVDRAEARGARAAQRDPAQAARSRATCSATSRSPARRASATPSRISARECRGRRRTGDKRQKAKDKSQKGSRKPISRLPRTFDFCLLSFVFCLRFSAPVERVVHAAHELFDGDFAVAVDVAGGAGGHVRDPEAMLTILISSLMSTNPPPSQSPTQPIGVAVAVDSGVAVSVSVGVGVGVL